MGSLGADQAGGRRTTATPLNSHTFNAENSPLRRLDPFCATVLLLGALLTSLALSPSSYGFVLARLGAPEAGLVWGQPQGVRSDEWGLLTPLMQVTVRNGHERINGTSPYAEDLRCMWALPLRDWAMAFKPQLWGFFFLPPSYAYSLYFAILLAAFLIGYAWLFRRLGMPSTWASAASVLFFFSPAIQTWWTVRGSLLAGFPWLLLVASSALGPAWKFLLLGYTSTVWLLSEIYPPLNVSLAFAGLITLAALRPQVVSLRNLLVCGAACATALAISAFYLWDHIQAMWGTIYPGQRVSGGGSVSPQIFLAQFFPHLTIQGSESLIPENVCEASTASSYLLLLALGFADGGALRQRLLARDPQGRALRRSVGILLGALVLIAAWMCLPVPASVGRLLLWDRVPPGRMVFPFGFLLLTLALVLLRAAPLRRSGVRAATTVGLGLGAWYASRRIFADVSLWQEPAELLVPLLLAAVPLLLWLRRLGAPSLLLAAAVANAIGFGGFNPLQSAKPIFDPPRTPLLTALQLRAASQPEEPLAIPLSSFPGATLNGLGFRAWEHALLAPRVEVFRELFPDLPASELDRVFNRFLSVIVLLGVPRPILVSPGTVVYLPRTRFPDAGAEPPPPLSIEPELTGSFPAFGRVVVVRQDDKRIVLGGWGGLRYPPPRGSIRVRTELPIERQRVRLFASPEQVKASGDPSLLFSGFEIELDLAADPRRPLSPRRPCVVIEDPVRGGTWVEDPRARRECGDLEAAPDPDDV